MSAPATANLIASLALAVSLAALAVTVVTAFLRGRRAEIVISWEFVKDPPREGSKFERRTDYIVLSNLGEATARDVTLVLHGEGADVTAEFLYSIDGGAPTTPFPAASLIPSRHRVPIEMGPARMGGPPIGSATVTFRDERRRPQTLVATIAPRRVG